VKFSIWPDPSRAPETVLDLARHVDGLGWHGFWYADHYMPNTGSEEFAPGDTNEVWAILPAVAAVTSSLRIGPLVSPTSVHHPALLANRAASIDRLSAGRMVLGLGAGWQINEHKAYGIELEAPGPRVSRFGEAIEVVRSLLDNDRTTFSGDFYEITDAPCDPKPVQDTLPLLVGTKSPRMLGFTARFADEWNTWGAPELAAECRAALVQACEKADRDPGSFHTSTQALVFLTDDQKMIDAVMGGDWANRTIAGTGSHLVDRIGDYADAGFDELIVPDFTFGNEPAQVLDAVDRFQAEVIDQLG
jgi:alkanesulfonate monooxygenase SsuD/methylene tetrahydromethanopterin reductase-like flavin-dependent oxidoreductase (luciferase family)